MNLFSLLTELAETDPELLQRLRPRRAALEQLGRLSGKTAAATVPLVLGSMLRQVHARDLVTVSDTLMLALTLELLENNFYSRALGLVPNTPPVAAGFIPTALRPGIATLQSHEQQHVAFLTSVLQASGVELPSGLNFDFTGSKNGVQPALFPDVFSNFDTFLLVAQQLEDAGVRAYKGQLSTVQGDRTFLDAALRIHTIEARHAAHIRTLRQARGASVKPWVSPSDQNSTISGKTEAVYLGDDTYVQKVPGKPAIDFRILPIDEASLGEALIMPKVAQSFDEPIDAATATRIASLFVY